jgi:hypothetical protein
MGKWNYDKGQKEPHNISRSKLDLYVECPRCFYMDQVLGVKRPGGPGWSLNSAVDNLFKNEFDYYRERGEQHPIMEKYNLELLPYMNENLSEWRDDMHKYIGAKVDIGDNITLSGIVDDIWVDKGGVIYIVDYKSTSTTSEISLDDKYKAGYKRQMEIYQFIYRKLGFEVSNKGYFVFANGQKDLDRFNDTLTFETTIIEYTGDDSWVEPILKDVKEVLNSDKIPEHGASCNFSRYLGLIKEKGIL